MNNPIKQYIEDRVFFPIEYYTKKCADLFVKKGYTSLYDSLWPFASAKNITFGMANNLVRYTSDQNRRSLGLF